MKIPNSVFQLKILNFSVLIASAVFIYVSASEAFTNYKAADIAYLARLIENGDIVSPETASAYAKQGSQIINENVCRSDIVKSGLSVLLQNLDSLQPEQYDEWAAALQATDSYLIHALSCLPTSGNLWLRLAMVRLTIAEQPDEMARLMRYAQWFAPSEINGVSSRLQVWNRVSASTLAKASNSVLSDLLIFQKHKLNKRFATIRPSLALQPYVDDANRLLASAVKG